MGRAKEIIIKSIPHKLAVDFVKKNHYSGKVVQNSTLHLGCFLDNQLHGVMQFGSPMDKSKVLPLVKDKEGKTVLWNEMLELNRMAFDDYLPKNSESRCFAIAIKLIKKNAPHIKWILSFSDAAQCGDGAIYRASGFELTAIKKNTQIIEMPCGMRIARLILTNKMSSSNDLKLINRKYNIQQTGAASLKPYFDAGAKYVDGFQLRYIFLIDKSLIIQPEVLPFSEIEKQGAGMYKGIKK